MNKRACRIDDATSDIQKTNLNLSWPCGGHSKRTRNNHWPDGSHNGCTRSAARNQAGDKGEGTGGHLSTNNRLS